MFVSHKAPKRCPQRQGLQASNSQRHRSRVVPVVSLVVRWTGPTLETREVSFSQAGEMEAGKLIYKPKELSFLLLPLPVPGENVSLVTSLSPTQMQALVCVVKSLNNGRSCSVPALANNGQSIWAAQRNTK